jgi:non-specific protein-tyrosine kinase
MSVRSYAEILNRRKWVIIATLALVLTVGVVATLLATPTYQASAMLRVLSVAGGGSADWVAYDTKQFERLVNTYAEFAVSRPVLDQLSERLGGTRPRVISVEILGGTELLVISIEDPDPEAARDAANELAAILTAKSRELYAGGGKTAQEILGEQLAQAQADLDTAWTQYEELLSRNPADPDRISAANRAIELNQQTYAAILEQYERARARETLLANTLSLVEPAVAPRAPAKPRRSLNIALAGVVGLGLGVGLALVFENLDTTLYRSEQIEALTQQPVLGEVPTIGKKGLSFLLDGNSSEFEVFRELRTSILSFEIDSSLKTLVVTSAQPGEGKSAIAANLAQAVAQTGREVILLDAHLRLPSIHRILGVSNRFGLSSVLAGELSLDDVIQTDDVQGIKVVTTGPLPPNPAELLSTPAMMDCLDELAERADIVIVDTPSLLAVTDAAVLAGIADGVILVVERGGAQQEGVRVAYQRLAGVRAKILGVIVNRAKPHSAYGYYRRVLERKA